MKKYKQKIITELRKRGVSKPADCLSFVDIDIQYKNNVPAEKVAKIIWEKIAWPLL